MHKNIVQFKSELVQQLVSLIQTQCDALEATIQVAVDGATNPESKPENKYDTRALESSYLAGAQAERLREMQGVRSSVLAMQIRDFKSEESIAASALVELDFAGKRSHYFILSYGSGFDLKSESDFKIHTLSLESPLGRALAGKVQGEFAVVDIAGQEREYEIISVQ